MNGTNREEHKTTLQHHLIRRGNGHTKIICNDLTRPILYTVSIDIVKGGPEPTQEEEDGRSLHRYASPLESAWLSAAISGHLILESQL